MYLLEPTTPYSLENSLLRLINRPRQVVGMVGPGILYTRAIEVDGQLGLVRVRPAGAGRLGVEVEGAVNPEFALAQVRQAFTLDLDHTAFLRHLDNADPTLAALARRFLGARPIRPFNHWESLAWAVIGQQVNVAYAHMMKESLVRLCDRSFRGYFAFPGPEAVTRLTVEQLRAEKFSRSKAEYLLGLARSVVAGDLDLGSALGRPADQATAELIRHKGVGRWTAECVLMDAGLTDALPADDIGIRNAVQRYYGLSDRPTAAQVRERGQIWAPWRSLASYYLWLGLTSE